MKSKVLTLALASLVLAACGEKAVEPEAQLVLDILGIQDGGLANQTVPASTPIPLEARVTGASSEDVVSVTWQKRDATGSYQMLGTGMSIAVSLDVGTHHIRATAKADDGREASASATFTIPPDEIGVSLTVCPENAYPNWKPAKSCVQARVTENPRKLETADTLRFNGGVVAFQGDALVLPNPLPQGQHQLFYKACTKSGSACDSAVATKEILPYPDLALRLQAVREDCHVHTGYDRMVVRLTAGNRQEEAQADQSGLVFFPESELAVTKDTILLTVRSVDGADTAYIPVYKRTTGAELRKGDPIGIIKRSWLICKGTYQGQVVPISLLMAYQPGGQGFSYLHRGKTHDINGKPYWLYALAAIPDSVEIPIVLDSATVQISPADSAKFWQILDRLEANSGRSLGRPTSWRDRPSDPDKMVLVDINPNIGGAGVSTFISDKSGNIIGGDVTIARTDLLTHLAHMIHELGGHALYGVGHVCEWVSAMGAGCNNGVSTSAEMTSDDVAHWRVMTRVVKFFQETGVKDVLPTSLNGERVFIHGLPPELDPVEYVTGPAMVQTTVTIGQDGQLQRSLTIKRLPKEP